ncbi:uncharacterized protein LOC128986204 [Macrosteles quadrilineatus]|uniref:uncharacterized protein LOC128986204 n=1 Tax=Macrosteles quadrilineatus TaxID=74068 RepID=UPI0023E2989D|nr:uncharacterized protein LOC128986204 [Macrosteles quadrilineatus]
MADTEVPHLLVALACCVAGVVAGTCPSLCECKWKSGKEAVLCLNANFSTIPLSLDAGTQVIDLTGNNLAEIGRDAFSKADLLNLQKIFVAKCRIKSLDRYAFRKLKNLVELDLSYNVLLAVPSHIFDSIAELRELKLSGNPILRVMNDAFSHIPQLVRLEMSDCRLQIVEPRAFNGLHESLEWLKLDKNKIGNIRSSTLTALQNLHGLELSGNPWNCSCSIRELREWMLRQNIPSSAPPVCKVPRRLHGKSWDRLNLDDFACIPSIAAHSEVFSGTEGGNVSLSCLISGSPDPVVRWYWKSRILPNVSSGVTSAKRPYVITVGEKVTYLTIVNLDLQDAGVYLCTAENKAGRVEGNVTLEVIKRVREAGFSWNVLLASIIVAVLFVAASCLVVVCMCSVKQKHGMPRARKESYEKMELNHKSCGPLAPTANHYTEVAVVAPTKQHPRHSEYRGVPGDDAEGEDEDDTPSTVVSDAKENIVEFTRGASRANRPSFGDVPVQHHVLRKEILPSGSLYTTATPSSDERNYPDLLETSPQPDHTHFFSTLPRSRGARTVAVSESQSPLLTDSRYGSSGGDSGGSRRLTSESRSSSYYKLSSVGEQRSSSTLNLSHGSSTLPGPRAWRHPSLPTSPVPRPVGPSTETPILDLLEQRPSPRSEYSPSVTTYDYHAAQLERFLEEYRSLQEQLARMKREQEESPPKSILKNKNSHSSPDSGDPYWVPRNTLYNAGRSSHNDYFPS